MLEVILILKSSYLVTETPFSYCVTFIDIPSVQNFEVKKIKLKSSSRNQKKVGHSIVRLFNLCCIIQQSRYEKGNFIYLLQIWELCNIKIIWRLKSALLNVLVFHQRSFHFKWKRYFVTHPYQEKFENA